MTLPRRRVLKRDQDLLCVFYESEQETSDHLFWKLWSSCLNWWGTRWVTPQTAKCLLESWAKEGTSKSFKRFWKILCYAILMSIWEERYKRCFQKKKKGGALFTELRVEEIRCLTPKPGKVPSLREVKDGP
ncbi:hypothetical protein QQ045_021011 [Rhodiola kirilowii]